MRRRLFGVGIGAWAAGLSVYVIALVVTVPATFVDARLQHATNGRLRLAAAHGTLWSGTGQLEGRDAAQRTGAAKSLSWRFRPRSLLRGQLAVDVRMGPAAKPFPVAITLSRIEVTDADIDLPAAVLALGEPRLAPLGLTGDVQLHITRVSISRSEMHGNATLQWRAAGSTFSPVSPLGDYELHLEGKGAAGRAALRTLQGPVQLDGTGSWVNGRIPKFRATARVLPQHQQQLAPLLRLIAVERGAGLFELQLQ